MQIHVQAEEQVLTTPVCALVVHENGRGRAVVTRHAVHQEKGQFTLGTGETLERVHLERLNRSLNGAQLHYIDGHVLARSESVIVWWEAAQKRALFFEGPSPDVQALSGQEVPFPALVFVADGPTLSVYALKENERPGPDTPLMRSPTYNTYQNGTVCLGSTVRPDPHDPQPEHAWSTAFFRSTFTHATAAPFLAWEGTYSELLKHSRRKRRFPPEALRPAGQTLKALLRTMSERSES